MSDLSDRRVLFRFCSCSHYFSSNFLLHDASWTRHFCTDTSVDPEHLPGRQSATTPSNNPSAAPSDASTSQPTISSTAARYVKILPFQEERSLPAARGRSFGSASSSSSLIILSRFGRRGRRLGKPSRREPQAQGCAEQEHRRADRDRRWGCSCLHDDLPRRLETQHSSYHRDHSLLGGRFEFGRRRLLLDSNAHPDASCNFVLGRLALHDLLSPPLYYFLVRSRIPLAKILLQVTMDVTKHSPSVYFVVLVSLVTQTIFSLWFMITVAATFVRFSPNTPFCAKATFLSKLKCSDGLTIGLIIFELFSFLWSSTVLSAVTLATLAGGPLGTWYYYGPRQKGRTPSHPTLKAFFRSITLNLGSLALGGLIVAILETICAILKGIMRSAAEDGNVVACCLACCIGCCVEWFTNLVEFFNKYAYISVALYGKSYIQSAKSTWRLFKSRGVDALVNDSIVGTALGFGALLVAVGCGATGFAFIRLTKPAYNDSNDWTGVFVLISALIGLQAGTTLGSAIDAGVSTIFVGISENPQILAERSPKLFHLISLFIGRF